MTVVVDANAIIMHGQAFPDRAREAVDDGRTIVVPRSVTRELVDDVLARDDAPPNHRDAARDLQRLVDDGVVRVRSPNFDRYGEVVDEARRRIADDSLPEHAVKADQYIPAVVCELAARDRVQLVTADRKLRRIVRDIADRRELGETVACRDPLTVL